MYRLRNTAPLALLALLLALVVGCRKPVPPEPTPPTPTADVSVTKVELSEQALLIAVGQSYRLTCILTPKDATSREVVWSTSDQSVATVSSSGELRGLALGMTSVTVTHPKSGLSATCKVIVRGEKASVTDISGVNL